MESYSKKVSELISELHSNETTGIASDAVSEIRKTYGWNQFNEQKGEGIGAKILRNLRDVSAIILLIAATISFVMGILHDEGYIEFIAIIAIVIMNLVLSVTQELSAEKSLAALKKLNSPTSIVLRDGSQQEIDSSEIVPGDILMLKAGNLISADARLIEAYDFSSDESSLTGESLPSEKDARAELTGKIPVADQLNMVFSGCLAVTGRAKAVVTATGMNTQMGRIAEYLNTEKKLPTPLQNRIDKVGKLISYIAVLAGLGIFVIGFIHNNFVWDMKFATDMMFAAIALAVAAVPETLPLIVTLALSFGVTSMVKQHALIRKLPAVETLGNASVICTDKTGTLTQNRMSIRSLWLEGSDAAVNADSEFTKETTDFLNKFAMAVNAVSEEQPDGTTKVIGLPTEAAVINLFTEKGGNKDELLKQYPKINEIPFSSERKMQTAIHKAQDGGYLVITLGAYDRVPFADTADKAVIEKRNRIHDEFANKSYRIIALGSKRVDTLPDEENLNKLESDLKFEGIIGVIDPPRPECAASIAEARDAGIRTVMITGDHAVTATAIARDIGLINSDSDKALTGLELNDISDEDFNSTVKQYSVYARVSPEDKIRIVKAWQAQGDVVTMTGDGVNDAPALKAADVGVAMGISGTEVAKDASDMVLTDDNFSTIVNAVHKGREVFSNIKKTVYYLFVCSFSEILIMLGAQALGWKMPITPVMLLFINVIGVGIPGLALARETSDPRIMKRPPIGRTESLFDGLKFVIIKQVLALSIVTWIGFRMGIAAGLDVGTAGGLMGSELEKYALAMGQTIAFLIVGWTSVIHVFTVRSRKSIFMQQFKHNLNIVYSSFAMIVVFALIVMIPQLASIFRTVSLGVEQWLLAAGLSIVPIIVAEIGKLFMNRK